jgi:hypothetical protein
MRVRFKETHTLENLTKILASLCKSNTDNTPITIEADAHDAMGIAALTGKIPYSISSAPIAAFSCGEYVRRELEKADTPGRFELAKIGREKTIITFYPTKKTA